MTDPAGWFDLADYDLVLTFRVPGRPVPQPRPRACVRGGRAHVYDRRSHPVHVYRQAISLCAASAARTAGHRAGDGVYAVKAVARFARPPSHLLASGAVRPAKADALPAGDWDNLAKAICDGITDSQAVWTDDRRSASGQAAKEWTRPGEPEETWVAVYARKRWEGGAR